MFYAKLTSYLTFGFFVPLSKNLFLIKNLVFWIDKYGYARCPSEEFFIKVNFYPAPRFFPIGRVPRHVEILHVSTNKKLENLIEPIFFINYAEITLWIDLIKNKKVRFEAIIRCLYPDYTFWIRSVNL